jgi:hypothetical protein
MRKSALLLAVVFAAAAPSLASAKTAKRVHAAPAPVAVASGPSDNGQFFHDAFHQIFVPAETIFRAPQAQPVAAPVRVRHARRHHRAA